jgi:hypothetical protein
MHDDAVDSVAVRQAAQQYEEVVAHGAGHASVRQLQCVLGGGYVAVAQRGCRPQHHVSVESVLDGHGSGPAQQHPRHRVGVALTCYQHHRRPHRDSFLLKTIVNNAFATVPCEAQLVENDFQ